MNIFKKIFILMAATLLISMLMLNTFAASECHWYIKHNGSKRPGFPKESNEIKAHRGYFIDERLSNDSTEKRLYLTFDAGYENGNIEKILDVLRKENVPAAFFLLDNIILKNTDLIIRMADEGHLVCNHTRNHKNLANASEAEIAENLSSIERIYEEKTGRTMAKYFRFPEGRYSIEALECVEKLGYKTIFWSFGYDDWDNSRQPNTEKAIKKILDNTHNGAIILLHPTSSTNAEILPTLITEWRKKGYSFGTLDDLTR
ncbi:MAG: delta-lactam-biosynthetic de-N-acetylase [Ruminococcaceae bacterium]|nr:delta-lactam-biosynthetic de-N-acetylase [Oscillospiraceae bacterium]